MKKIIKVGSRESKLAMVQSEWVINEIKKKHPELEFKLVGMKTTGDIILDKSLDKIGGKGLFIKELEHALINNSIDIAVHSMKDMPADIPDELCIAAVSKREDPRDVLVTPDGKVLEELEQGALIGTGSVRREVQLLSKRPDLRVGNLRGNVLTRLNKLLDKQYDALMLAGAGLKRLGLEDKCSYYFDVDDIIPAVGQGVLCIEARKADETGYLLDSIHCVQSQLEVAAERAFMISLNGGCSTPIAAHAITEGEKLKLCGMRASDDKATIYRAYLEGSKYEAVNLGKRLAEMVLKHIPEERNNG